ncbi:hypothetical protein VIGAN_02197500 [Vigna angularis var. angularis]|uniref:Uncharacterized protein n=1 Tax=Vigna angularis var. angularis TaxID=157739 RepID=A0A0S3RF33_PHAAN|nr:hypothetical protein VIGAN_02197500 [Vigna angularis var. angularis]
MDFLTQGQFNEKLSNIPNCNLGKLENTSTWNSCGWFPKQSSKDSSFGISTKPLHGGKVSSCVSEMKVKKEELKVKKELLGLVGTVVGLNKRLESVKEALRSGRFEFAAQGLKELKVAFRIDEKDDREPLVNWLISDDEKEELSFAPN